MGFLFPQKAAATGAPACVRNLSLNGSSKRSIFSRFSLPSLQKVIRLLYLAVAVVLVVCLSLSYQAKGQTATLVQARQADLFVDSVGAVTHLTYLNTNYYRDWPTVFYDLQRLGVRHIRDGYQNWGAGSPFFSEHRQLASASIKTTYVIPYSPATTAASVEGVAQEAGDMEAVEDPNECDVAGYCGTTAAQSMAHMFSTLPTVNAAGKRVNVPVIGPSFANYTTYSQVGNLASKMTSNNLHVYFGGRNPGSNGWGVPDAKGNNYGSLAFWLDMANEDAPGVPVMITETGYMMFPQPRPYTIPYGTGASYIPRTLLLAYTHGIKRTYLYELLEEPSAPGYGLIDGNMVPKPAFHAVECLINTLSDEGPSFTPGKLAYSLTGGSPALKQVLFQKRDGSFWLVLWLEESSYDEVNLKETPVTAEKVNLQVKGNHVVSNIGTIENNGEMNWTSTNPAGPSDTIPVSDAVTIVKIVPGN